MKTGWLADKGRIIQISCAFVLLASLLRVIYPPWLFYARYASDPPVCKGTRTMCIFESPPVSHSSWEWSFALDWPRLILSLVVILLIGLIPIAASWMFSSHAKESKP